MKKKPFQEQLSKFSLLGELPKVETGLEEAWENLKKCTEPFEVRDIIKQQQETINRQQAEIERLQNENNQFAYIGKLYSEIKTEAIKEFAERLKDKCKQARFSVTVTENLTSTKKVLDNIAVVDENDIDNLVKEMVGDAE